MIYIPHVIHYLLRKSLNIYVAFVSFLLLQIKGDDWQTKFSTKSYYNYYCYYYYYIIVIIILLLLLLLLCMFILLRDIRN